MSTRYCGSPSPSPGLGKPVEQWNLLRHAARQVLSRMLEGFFVEVGVYMEKEGGECVWGFISSLSLSLPWKEKKKLGDSLTSYQPNLNANSFCPLSLCINILHSLLLGWRHGIHGNDCVSLFSTQPNDIPEESAGCSFGCPDLLRELIRIANSLQFLLLLCAQYWRQSSKSKPCH